jgi:hypothetical protein
MAIHVNKAADVWVPALSAADFTAQLQHGDILFCSGAARISLAIERETKSPWSHVGYVMISSLYAEPLLIEAVFKFGVRVSRLIANYIGPYDGDVVLCRRAPGLISAEGMNAIIAKAISRLGDGYDWQSEIQQAAHNLLDCLPEHATEHELYCSGLVQYASTAWSPALMQPNPNVAPSPEDIWCDPTVVPVCRLLKGTK